MFAISAAFAVTYRGVVHIDSPNVFRDGSESVGAGMKPGHLTCGECLKAVR